MRAICDVARSAEESENAFAGLKSILDRHLAVVSADRHHHNGDIVRVIPDGT
jgi:hypothetical protein